MWRRERLDHEGKKYTVPLPADQGTGLGKPLKLINTPVRERIPVMLAALGPKNVELAAEIAEAWEPIFFYPEKAATVWGDSLAAGKAKRDPALGELQVVAGVPVAIGDDVDAAAGRSCGRRLALYIGGMGARGKNFYNDLAVRYGYEAEAKTIQDLYLDGKKDEAAAAVPAGAGPGVVAHRPGGLRRRADRRLRRGRRQHADAAAPRRQPRGPPEDRGDHEAPGRLSGVALG